MDTKFNFQCPGGWLLMALFAVTCNEPSPVLAQTSAPNEMAASPATNVISAPQMPEWWPTEEQQKLERDGRFMTVQDKRYQQLHHRVLTPTLPDPKEGSTCNVTRSLLQDGRSVYSVEIIVNRAITQPALFFDGLKPMVFTVDGVKFTCSTFAAQVQSEKKQGGGAVAWKATYGAKATEELVRALGKAKEASVSVPCKSGSAWERKFSPDDMGRFATFVRVYLPKP